MSFTLKEIFSDFVDSYNAEASNPNWQKEVLKTYSYPTVHQLDQEPLNLIQPALETGPWIAGGACLHWYQGLPTGNSDIDVFCKNAVQAAELIKKIKSYGRYSTKFESENAVTLDYRSHDSSSGVEHWTIQVITKRYYNSLEEVINNFDVTVCQIGTAGEEYVMGDWTARDIRERNLRMNIPLQADALKRLTKYWTYGYRPVDGLLEAIQNNPVARWEFNPNEDYS